MKRNDSKHFGGRMEFCESKDLALGRRRAKTKILTLGWRGAKENILAVEWEKRHQIF